MITVSILDWDFLWNKPSSYGGTSIERPHLIILQRYVDPQVSSRRSPAFLPWRLWIWIWIRWSWEAGMNLVDLVDLELRSNWRVLRYWGIFNDTHVINVIYIIYRVRTVSSMFILYNQVERDINQDHHYLVGGFKHALFFHILGIITLTD